jgi:hypothetical protein
MAGLSLVLVAAASRSRAGCGLTRPYSRHSILELLSGRSAWGSDDPTKAAFPFSHGHALAEAGHEVRIFLLGEAVGLMRRSVAEAVVPVGWPPVSEVFGKVAARHVRQSKDLRVTRGVG